MLLMTAAKLLLALANSQEPTTRTPGPMMWTGKGNGLYATDKEAPGYAAALRAELTGLVTRTDVQRDYPAQLEKLEMLRGRACWSPAYPGKAELASEIAEVRADWLEKLGRHSDAVYAAHHALVMPGESNVTPYTDFDWVTSNGLQAELVNQIDALPRMIELHKRFPSNAPATKGGDAIEEVVINTLDHGDPRTLKDFGTRCVPALQKAILNGPDEYSQADGTKDPLSVLIEIDRRSAESLILSTVGKRSPAWTLRAIRALSNSGVTSQSWVDSTDPLQPPRFDDPLTQQMIDALAAQPMSASGFFALLQPLVRNDAITPAIESYLLGHTQASDPQIISILCDMLDGQACGPNKRALYEAFLASSSPDLRQRSAKAMRRYPVGPATLRATQHSDPNVRSNALYALVRHFEKPYRYGSGPSAERIEYAVPRTPEIEAALLKLTKDPEPTVRWQLVRALQEAREEPPADVLEALLSDPDAQVRQVSAFDWSFKPELQARVLEQLAGDKDAQVLRSVGFAFNARTPRDDARGGEFQLYLPALARWLANPALNPAFEPNSGPNRPIGGAMLTPAGARAVFEACLRGPHSKELVPLLLDSVTWARDRQSGTAVVDTLEAPRIAELFTLCCTNWQPQQVDRAQQALFEFVARGELDAAPFLELARDEQRTRALRLRALMIAAQKGGPAFKTVALDVLRGSTPAELASGDQSCRDFLNLLNNVLKVWPELDQSRAEVCGDARIADGLALYVVGFGYKAAPLDAVATSACLQRWAHLDEGWKRWDDRLLYRLDPRTDPAVLELWRSAYRTSYLCSSVVGAMGKFPIDESVPLLTECVGADWMSGTGDEESVRNEAIRVLTMRLDDLGADALLKAIASARNDEARKKCFDGLEQIRKYQDEKQSWQKRKGGEAAREQAIADLLPMLGDKDPSIRAAAARSLGTLRGIEHLPKLVALLKDKDGSVREAAQKALDALNAPEPRKP